MSDDKLKHLHADIEDHFLRMEADYLASHLKLTRPTADSVLTEWRKMLAGEGYR